MGHLLPRLVEAVRACLTAWWRSNAGTALVWRARSGFWDRASDDPLTDRNALPVFELDPRLVSSDQVAQDPAKFVDVSRRERIDEVVTDSLLVSGPDLFEPATPLRSQGDVETPPVAVVKVSANEPVALHSIEHAGEAAATERVSEHHGRSEVLQRKSARRRPGKVNQHIELLYGEARSRKIAPESLHDQRSRPLKLTPHCELAGSRRGHQRKPTLII